MTIDVIVGFKGQKELEDALRKLPAEMVSSKGGLVKTALMAAALPMLNDMKSQIAGRWKDEGELLATVGRRRVAKPKVNEEVRVGVLGKRGPKKDADGRTFLAPFWLELGTVRIPPDPIVLPVFDSRTQEAVGIYKTRLAAGIARIAKKIGDENTRKVAMSIKKL